VSAVPLRERLGPLVEREYRLLFSATTITTLGDAVAGIALAFAVLDLTGRATDLGIVIATRQAANAAVALARSLFRKGANFAAAMAFQIASTTGSG